MLISKRLTVVEDRVVEIFAARTTSNCTIGDNTIVNIGSRTAEIAESHGRFSEHGIVCLKPATAPHSDTLVNRILNNAIVKCHRTTIASLYCAVVAVVVAVPNRAVIHPCRTANIDSRPISALRMCCISVPVRVATDRIVFQRREHDWKRSRPLRVQRAADADRQRLAVCKLEDGSRLNRQRRAACHSHVVRDHIYAMATQAEVRSNITRQFLRRHIAVFRCVVVIHNTDNLVVVLNRRSLAVKERIAL